MCNKPGEYLLGVAADGPFRMSFARHAHHGYSMATGRGKSTLAQHVTAQILGQHEGNRVVCTDTKVASLLPLDGLPGLELHNDPDDVAGMMSAGAEIVAEMRHRYRALRAGGTGDFPLLVWLMEEANDFADAVLAQWRGQKGTKVSEPPPFWREVAAPVLRQGRQVGVHVVGMFQDFLDNQFGGVPLRPQFEVIGMSGWKPQQWDRIIGSKPAARPQPGKGRILVCDGEEQTWVQGLRAEPGELIRFVRERRG